MLGHKVTYFVHVECESNADELGNCLNGFALPDCCNCPPGLTEDNGVCSEFYYYNYEHKGVWAQLSIGV